MADEILLTWVAPELPAGCPYELIPSYNGNTNKFLGVNVHDRREVSPHGMPKFCEFFESTEDAVECVSETFGYARWPQRSGQRPCSACARGLVLMHEAYFFGRIAESGIVARQPRGAYGLN